MDKTKRKTTDRFLDDHSFGFVIEWGVEDHWADFKVFQVTSVSLTESRVIDFLKQGYENSSDTTTSTEEAEPYLEGFIKWDGCCEFGTHTHYCGSDCLKKHAALVEFLYKRAPELMGRGWDNLDMSWDHGGSSLRLREKDEYTRVASDKRIAE